MIRSGEVAPTTAIQVINSTDTSGEAVEILQTAVETAKAEGKTKATSTHVEQVKEAKGQTPKKLNPKRILEQILPGAPVIREEEGLEAGKILLEITEEEYQMLWAIIEPK